MYIKYVVSYVVVFLNEYRFISCLLENIRCQKEEIGSNTNLYVFLAIFKD
jgi:hypothetical protein